MMKQNELKTIIENADMIVNGFAFSIMPDSNIRVIYIHGNNHACIIDKTGDVIETNMDDIELSIVKNSWANNGKFITENTYA